MWSRILQTYGFPTEKIAALAGNWAKLGRSIDNSARGIGISSGQLQSFQGAAKMVGIDAGATTASLDGLATTMQDAQWGRNQGAVVMLNKLGIGLKKSTDGAWDVVGEYKAIANAIASEKSPQVQALIANNLGRLGKTLRTGSAAGDKLLARGVWDDEEEARFIGEDIDRLRREGIALNNMAILVRASFQMRAFEDRFITMGLPYRVIGGPRFYERLRARLALQRSKLT